MRCPGVTCKMRCVNSDDSRLRSAAMTVVLTERVPAPVLFVLGGVSMYVGAALAVGLFAELPPAAVALLRMLGAAAVLLAWRRPGRAAWRGGRLVRAGAFGLATALMNVAFYEAIARL